jgi:hypothetical protein
MRIARLPRNSKNSLLLPHYARNKNTGALRKFFSSTVEQTVLGFWPKIWL